MTSDDKATFNPNKPNPIAQLKVKLRLEATTSSASTDMFIKQSQGFET